MGFHLSLLDNWISTVFVFFSDLNECLQITCYNGGTCTNLDGSYKCNCPTGYTGEYCQLGKLYRGVLSVRWVILGNTVR